MTRSEFWEDHEGPSRTTEVLEQAPRVSALLGPNGLPLVHLKPRMGFDLTPRRVSNA
jgi:hypothetical protein